MYKKDKYLFSQNPTKTAEWLLSEQINNFIIVYSPEKPTGLYYFFEGRLNLDDYIGSAQKTLLENVTDYIGKVLETDEKNYKKRGIKVKSVTELITDVSER